MLRLAAIVFAMTISSIACAAEAPQGAVLLIGNKGEDTCLLYTSPSPRD